METPSGVDVESPVIASAYRFGAFELDLVARRLSAKGEEIRLSPRVYSLLEYLVLRPGEAVSRDDLIEELWGGTIVSDHSLTEAVSRLRGVLEDDPKAPAYIQTIPAFGFRFVAEVEALEADGRPLSTWPPLWKLALPGVVLSGLMLAAALGTIFSTAGPAPGEHLTLNTITLPDGAPMIDAAASLSPDEQFLAFAQSSPPRLRLMDLRTEEVTTLGALDRIWNGRSLRWSPDSSTIAFGDRPINGGWGRLELFEVATGTRTVLLETDRLLFLLGWHPSGDRMLVWVSGELAPGEVSAGPGPESLIWLIDREGQVLAEWPNGTEAYGGRVSPDGRWLAMAQWGDEGGEIVVVPIADVWSGGAALGQDYFRDWSHGARITDPPCADDPPIWNEASDKLVFFTFRGRDRELWTVDLDEGQPLGQPRPMQVPGDPYIVQGWTADGRVLFCSLRAYGDVALATLDPASATLAGAPLYLSVWDSTATMPAWSSDPDRVMFVSRAEKRGGDLYIAPAGDDATGTAVREKTRIEVDRPFRNPAWSFDGAHVYYAGGLDEGGFGLFEQDLATGASRRLLPDEVLGGNVLPSLDSSGDLILFNTLGPRPGREGTLTLAEGLYLYDLAADQLRYLDDTTNWPAALSPDGEWVALSRPNEVFAVAGVEIQVELLAVDGGERRTLAVVPPGGWETTSSFAFSPDGATLAYIIRRRPPESLCNDRELWLVDLAGGAPRKVEALDALNPWRVAWSRTGNRLALSTDECHATVQFYAPLLVED